MMTDSSTALLTHNLRYQLAQLAVLREYHQKNDDPYFKSAVSLAIEDTQEGIARIASRLRQLGQPLPDQKLDEAGEKLLWQAQHQKGLEAHIRFVQHGLKHQFDWYNTHVKEMKHDSDSQAIFVALAEQTRVRLEGWETMMRDLKVLLD